nr:RNA-directed DNA polymerase, eukaryota, reverse transcriptase zinc-binding domain protein [Tanacetum cinerariifolium]
MCSIAKDVCKEVMAWWKVSGVLVTSVDEAALLSDRVLVPSKLKKPFDVAVNTTLWHLWNFRNNAIFSSNCPRNELLLNGIKLSSFNWFSNLSGVASCDEYADEAALLSDRVLVPSKLKKPFDVAVNTTLWHLWNFRNNAIFSSKSSFRHSIGFRVLQALRVPHITLPSFEEYTPPVTYPEEVEKTLGTPIEVEPLNKTKLEEVDASLGTERGLKPQCPDSFRTKVLDNLTIHTPHSSLVASFHLRDLYCYYRPCIGDPKKHYGFKPGLLGHSGSLGVDFSKLEMIDDDWGLESKEVYFLGR